MLGEIHCIPAHFLIFINKIETYQILLSVSLSHLLKYIEIREKNITFCTAHHNETLNKLYGRTWLRDLKARYSVNVVDMSNGKYLVQQLKTRSMVYGEAKAKTWPLKYQWKNGIIFDKMDSMSNKGQSPIHKAENLFDFGCPLFVARENL